MRQLDPEKLAKLTSFNDELDKAHGTPGTDSRRQFDEKSIAWFYGNMLKERRKELNLTQKQLAEKLGREQSYIARIENGKNRHSNIKLFPNSLNARHTIRAYIHVIR